MRDQLLYLEDMLKGIKSIEKYTRGMSLSEFKAKDMVIDAVLRNLEIIGEAGKKVSKEIRSDYSEKEWKKICGLRDILIHDYISVDIAIIWDIRSNKLPKLKRFLKKSIKNI
jgi:uncharacterized protein with HEPN domain